MLNYYKSLLRNAIPGGPPSRIQISEYQQIEKFSDCRSANTTDGGETRLFPAGETLRPGKKPGFFAVPHTARKLFDLLNIPL
ncbi:Uncharacterized protein dnm_008020 [Desulfonema magnum]|uniref:Uncharacterized protein n=1 Tax=Desulfonema magnum TaxID=45655 RepID=A0A975BFZ6_9BACT|nr:Uncharacterized protein dnm_008020 [Desulfonema magnum]